MACSRYRRFLILGVLLLADTQVSGADRRPLAPLTVGQLRLRHCETAAPWCGRIVRALDTSGEVPGTISLYFEYYPHSASGTCIRLLSQPLRRNQDVLIMDNRGTGRSGAVNCRRLQNAPALTQADIGACGRALGSAAPLYSPTL